jgi:hypothetical protein
MSETVAVAIIAGASGVVGAAIGGAATFAAQRTSQKAQRREDLATTLGRLLHGLQLLEVELRALPPPKGPLHTLTRWIDRRIPSLGVALNLLARHTTARSAYRSLEAVSEPLSRLLLIAPDELLPKLDRLATTIKRVDRRGDAWLSDWQAARSELVTCARLLLD